MSRSGYEDDLDNWELIKWRGRVASAIRGKRGQKLLQDLAVAMDAMPAKELIREELVTDEGERCALGVVGQARGLDLSTVDPEDSEYVAEVFGIAEVMAREIVYINDEAGQSYPEAETPAQRWTRVREWVTEHLNEVHAL
jgi:hypothetical protein